MTKPILLLLLAAAVAGCKPEVGSREWCEALDEKPKGDWTANEIADYSRHCIFRKSEN